MAYGHGRILKRLHLSEGGCVDIIARPDGAFMFFHRVPCEADSSLTDVFESGVYISAQAAEAAARQKFKL
jgi:hypothetical protein